jgi:hypothetical protein
MPRSLSFAVLFTLFAAVSAVAHPQDSSAPAPPAPTQDSQTPAETKKPKKVWTNDDLSGAKGGVSVVGDPKNKPKPSPSKPANDQYVASVRKQLDKLQGQIADIDKQLVDLKNFSEGEPSTSARASSSTRATTANPSRCKCAHCRTKRKIFSPKLTRCLTKPARKASGPASCAKKFPAIGYARSPARTCGLLPFPNRSIEMEEAVVLAEPHRSPKQIRKVLYRKNRGLGPVSQNVSFAQENHALDLRNDFRYLVCHQ